MFGRSPGRSGTSSSKAAVTAGSASSPRYLSSSASGGIAVAKRTQPASSEANSIVKRNVPGRGGRQPRAGALSRGGGDSARELLQPAQLLRGVGVPGGVGVASGSSSGPHGNAATNGIGVATGVASTNVGTSHSAGGGMGDTAGGGLKNRRRISLPNGTSASASASALVPGDTHDPIRVCVRVRPPTGHELQKDPNELCPLRAVDPPGGLVELTCPLDGSRKEGNVTAWQFDHCFDSNATQADVFAVIGEETVRSVADGFHGCIFAYGQTGSGKSHSVFGGGAADAGLVLRVAEGLLTEVSRANGRNAATGNAAAAVAAVAGGTAEATSEQEQKLQGIVKLSYIEIYNERVRDLLCPEPSGGGQETAASLEMRQHPKFGVFVEDLTENVVRSVEDVARLLDFGHKIRVVGRTNMNVVSSRSHAIVMLSIERNLPANSSKAHPHSRLRLRSRFSAVDLAGAERGGIMGSGNDNQCIERGNINRSLFTLGFMISRLAQEQASGNVRNAKHVPYRSSKLTYLLSDSLVGNCRTAMLACVSPTVEAFAMTESTLRFANCVKQIRTRPVRNEESLTDLVSSLRAEIESLKKQLASTSKRASIDVSRAREVLQERILTAEKLEEQVASPWTKQCSASIRNERGRAEVLEGLGIAVEHLQQAWSQGEMLGRVSGDVDPYLVNVCSDPLLSGCLTYTLHEGEEVYIGSGDHCRIRIDGLGIQPVMCRLVSCDGGKRVSVLVYDEDGVPRESPGDSASCSSPSQNPCRSSLFKIGAPQVFLNGEVVHDRVWLHDRDRLRVGCTHRFKLFIPRADDSCGGLQRKKTVEAIIDDLVDTSEQVLAKEFASQLEERIGRTRATGVFRELAALQPLIDEANEITHELRGGDMKKLGFKTQVLADVSSDNYQPDVLVALRLVETGDTSSRVDVQLDPSELQSGQLVAIWPVLKFTRQLEAFRDLYQEISERERPWQHGVDPNPWEDETPRARRDSDGGGGSGSAADVFNFSEGAAASEAAQLEVAKTTQKVFVTVIQATGLKKLNFAGSDAPSCCCEVRVADAPVSRTSHPYETRVVPRTTNPVWNETYEIDSWCLGKPLIFSIREKDGSPNRVEGTVVVKAEQFYPHGLEVTLPIEGVESATLGVRILPVDLRALTTGDSYVSLLDNDAIVHGFLSGATDVKKDEAKGTPGTAVKADSTTVEALITEATEVARAVTAKAASALEALMPSAVCSSSASVDAPSHSGASASTSAVAARQLKARQMLCQKMSLPLDEDGGVGGSRGRVATSTAASTTPNVTSIGRVEAGGESCGGGTGTACASPSSMVHRRVRPSIKVESAVSSRASPASSFRNNVAQRVNHPANAGVGRVSVGTKGVALSTADEDDCDTPKRELDLMRLRQELSRTSLAASSRPQQVPPFVPEVLQAPAVTAGPDDNRDEDISTLKKRLDDLAGELKAWKRRATNARRHTETRSARPVVSAPWLTNASPGGSTLWPTCSEGSALVGPAIPAGVPPGALMVVTPPSLRRIHSAPPQYDSWWFGSNGVVGGSHGCHMVHGRSLSRPRAGVQLGSAQNTRVMRTRVLQHGIAEPQAFSASVQPGSTAAASHRRTHSAEAFGWTGYGTPVLLPVQPGTPSGASQGCRSPLHSHISTQASLCVSGGVSRSESSCVSPCRVPTPGRAASPVNAMSAEDGSRRWRPAVVPVPRDACTPGSSRSSMHLPSSNHRLCLASAGFVPVPASRVADVGAADTPFSVATSVAASPRGVSRIVGCPGVALPVRHGSVIGAKPVESVARQCGPTTLLPASRQISPPRVAGATMLIPTLGLPQTSASPARGTPLGNDMTRGRM
eukprot:TRINITY_DN48148_c0_g1_i1.p1 TRINITY_DN48148_c0_g1~~TRINITY_DN48148_c0_g1_i1.p1  ORF type:complete len:1831 (+),score=248.79 TRINITY_DN48148_c0_g1_i1:42-5534(+)